MVQSLLELAKGLQVLSTSDLLKPVRNTIQRLAGLHRQAHQWGLNQATNELEGLITTSEAHARLTFNGRVKWWDKLQYSINHLMKIQSNHESIKRSCSPNNQSIVLMYPLAELDDPTSASSVENLVRDLDLSRDHKSSLLPSKSPSESHHQHELLQEQQPAVGHYAFGPKSVV
ncbi:Vacuolar protein sorting-associated protein 5 [Puccinia graminis f. sp. tritici]|uniref:Vacuolar protein sorting-associated protein 5 n=1 Tax=Puccinia graminis f. sp. tritici TaxID=56615 RepID=A0A5B0P5N2_PUCGR|nr:Vacuolar protein sorting-associated protein 5 [Puccinia graminis f. sp. tritici]KAA1099625.1 Vacuolar protein sorting-associated protein 5 [Puccinia graminis f. sp. tritici]